MIRIKMITESKGSYELHAKGHALYSKSGQDIVCAAVSVLIFTLLESIDENDLSFPPVVILEKGKAFIRIKPKDENKEKICGVFEVICKGFEILQNNFSKNVKFTRFGG